MDVLEREGVANSAKVGAHMKQRMSKWWSIRSLRRARQRPDARRRDRDRQREEDIAPAE